MPLVVNVNRLNNKKKMHQTAAGCEELTNMEQDPEERSIVEWLQMVDKPLTTKRTQGQETKMNKMSPLLMVSLCKQR